MTYTAESYSLVPKEELMGLCAFKDGTIEILQRALDNANTNLENSRQKAAGWEAVASTLQSQLDEQTVRIQDLEFQTALYKQRLEFRTAMYHQLADYNERVCRECDDLRSKEPGIWTQSKSDLLVKVEKLSEQVRTLQDWLDAKPNDWEV